MAFANTACKRMEAEIFEKLLRNEIKRSHLNCLGAQTKQAQYNTGCLDCRHQEINNLLGMTEIFLAVFFSS